MPSHLAVAFAVFLSHLALNTGCASGDAISRGRDRYAVGGGAEDYGNDYQTVVKVRGKGKATCSGILIAQRLVLTAAHCFCETTEKAFVRSSCEKETTVTRVFYFYDDERKLWVGAVDSTKGEIVVHGDYTPQYTPGSIYVDDNKKFPDIAVVRMDRALTEGRPPEPSESDKGVERSKPEKELRADVKLRATEVVLNQGVVVVGYGASQAKGKDIGVRRFGENVVANLRLMKEKNERDREIRLIFPGGKVFEGDSGGPCLIEDEEGRWLVGIIGGYGDEGAESWITSIFGYRGWINEQIAESAKPATR